MVSDCVSVMLFFSIDSVADSDPVSESVTVPVTENVLKFSNVIDSEWVSITVGVTELVRD